MYLFSNCFNYLFSKAHQKTLQIFRQELQEVDLTPVQAGFLSYLVSNNGAAPAQLASHFGLEGSTVTGILDRMEKKGLLERRINPDDRRTYHIVVTQAGWDLSEPVLKCSKRANKLVAEMIGKDDAPLFLAIMQRINSNGNA
jgi:DNA-binding MarR family transcriptional regulator